MSDTPRTDKHTGLSHTTCKLIAESRQLERELLEAREEIHRLKTACNKFSEDEILCTLTQQRDRLAEILSGLDPMPNEPIDDAAWPGAAYCEISIGEMRDIRATLAAVKGEQS
jgi:hypothetical protein